MGVVDDHLHAVELEHIEPSRRFMERWVEAAEPLPDIVQVRAGGVRRRRGGQSVLHVCPGPALEGGRQQVDPADLGATSPLAKHHHLAAPGLLLNDEGFAPAPYPALHQFIVIAQREEDHRAAAMCPHVGHQLVVGIEDCRPVARDRLHDDPLDRGQLP